MHSHRSDSPRTVRAGDLAPDHPDVGAPNLALGPVDESDLLAQVEAIAVLAFDPYI